MEFFLVNLVFMLISLFAYIYFRTGISAYCSLMKMSKSFIRKNKKGVSNYWLYKQLHQEKNLGSFYYINYLFLSSLAAFVFISMFSWVKWMRIPVIVVGIALGLIEIPAIFKALISINREEIGRAFVLFSVFKGYNGKSRRFATVLDWIFCILPLAIYILLLTRLFL